MKNSIRLWVIALITLLPWAVEAAKVDSVQVKSASMNKAVQIVVVTPDLAETKACPVIYLLHGYSGNAKTWIGIKPNLPQIADEKGIIFVSFPHPSFSRITFMYLSF